MRKRLVVREKREAFVKLLQKRDQDSSEEHNKKREARRVIENCKKKRI
jgi:hypothetical protein